MQIELKMIIQRSGIGRLKAANRIAIILTACFAIVFWGCEGKKTPPKEPVVTKQIASSAKKTEKPNANIKGKNGAPVDGKPAPKVADNAVNKRTPYNPIGKVDPFAPLYKEEAKKKTEDIVAKAKEPERPRTPLEKLDLAQLKLTAIVTAKNQKRALVEEASGKGYVVEVGTKIGLERGTVVAIDPDRIIIENEAKNDFGKMTIRKRELKLQKPPGD